MKKKVYAYLHTHWDIEWYRDNQDFNLRFLDVFNIVLNELTNKRAPFFYLDGQIGALEYFLKIHPEKEKTIKKLVKENKLALGPYYVSADTYLTSFNSMLKNIDIGIEFAQKYDQKEYIGYLSDVFGISKSAFDALKLKNIDKALIWRGVNPKKINNSCNFIKNSINTTWLVQGYFNDFFHQENINTEGIEDYLNKISKYSENICLLPIGADHLGMLKDANKKISFVNSKLKNYEIILTSPFEYFKNTHYIHQTSEEEFLDNSNTFILQGVYSARIPQKIKNNEMQNLISRIAEPLNFYLKDKYKKNIDLTYKTLLKNHAHDGIYGCSIDSVHQAIDYRSEECKNSLNAIIQRIKGNFKKSYNIQGESINKIGVINLSNSKINTLKIKLPYILKNSQVIEKENCFPQDLYYDIYKIPVTEDIKTHYTQIVEITPVKNLSFTTAKIKKAIKKTKTTNNSIENDFIKLEIKNENITILNKKTKEKFNLFLSDTKDEGDSYNFSPKGERAILKPQKSKVEYDGDIQSCLFINFKNIKLYAILDNNSDFIKFKTKINNKHKNHKLQLVLKLKENISQTCSQDAIGIVKRKIDFNYKMSDFMPAIRPIELKTNMFPMQNFVCANNIIALTKGLHEYEIYQNELRICLLRAFSTISNPKNKTRSIPAGPDLKTPEAQCLFEFETNFILSFGNYKKAFTIVDNLFENYLAIDGEFKKEINIKFDEIPKDNYFLGLNENKKILYNIKENKISMI